MRRRGESEGGREAGREEKHEIDQILNENVNVAQSKKTKGSRRARG